MHKECKEFNYEVDMVLDLSSDVSQGMPSEPMDLKSLDIFDEYER